MSRDEVLDELIRFGWIDGFRRRLDDNRTMQLIGQRQVQHWATTYKIPGAKLIASGRTQPAELAAIVQRNVGGDLSSALGEVVKALNASGRFVVGWSGGMRSISHRASMSVLDNGHSW